MVTQSTAVCIFRSCSADHHHGALWIAMEQLKRNIWPYIELMRLNRPVGILLLMLPCSWGIALAPVSFWTKLLWLCLFALGAVAMRSAGCAFNDWVDRDIDAYVERTQYRPLATGKLTTFQAFTTIAANCLIAILVWWQLPSLGKFFSFVGFGFAFFYPFTKRWTQWPQVILGLAFNSGVLVAWGSINPHLTKLPAILCLYAAGVFWTLAYDTVYAIPDHQDDEQLGVGSSVLALKPYGLKKGLFFFYWTCFSLLIVAGILATLTWPYYLFVLIGINWQLWWLYRFNPDDSVQCFQFFKANTILGWGIFSGIILSTL